jgi:tetratricopeptide (TPR) repeat protein
MSAPAWFSLGLAREGLKDFPSAREAFTKALTASDYDHRITRGEILERLGRASWEMGRVDEARILFERAHAAGPDLLSARLYLALLASREGKPEEVLRLLDPMLPRRAENPAILLLSANALDAIGQINDAQGRRAEAIALFPDDPAVQIAARSPANRFRTLSSDDSLSSRLLDPSPVEPDSLP